jgi:hypothetical protein
MGVLVVLSVDKMCGLIVSDRIYTSGLEVMYYVKSTLLFVCRIYLDRCYLGFFVNFGRVASKKYVYQMSSLRILLCEWRR